MSLLSVRGIHPLVQTVAGAVNVINAKLTILQNIVGSGGNFAGGQSGAVQFKSTSGGFTGSSDLVFHPENGLDLGADLGYQIGGADILTTPGNNSLVVGPGSSVHNQFCVAVGVSSSAGTPSDIGTVGRIATAIGPFSRAAGQASVSIGFYAASVAEAVAIGGRADSSGAGAIAIGYDSTANNTNSITIGVLSRSTRLNTIAIGSNSNALFSESIAIGSSSIIGQTFGTLGDNSIAIGASSSCNMSRSIAIGSSCQIEPTNTGDTGAISTVIGSYSNSTVGGAVVVGSGSTAGHTNTIVLGNSAQSSAANQIALPTGFAQNTLSGTTGSASAVTFAGMASGQAARALQVSIGGVEYIIPLYQLGA